MQSEIEKNISEFKKLSVDQIINAACAKFSPKIGIASSFSMEDIVLIDLFKKSGNEFKVFSLQTGRLNPETIEVANQVEQSLGIKINWFHPLKTDVDKLESEKGLFSFKQSVEERKYCCSIRKVEPLKRALKELDAWVTGQRRAQSVTRNELALAEYDQANTLYKFNPLAFWSYEQVQQYVKANNLPYNKLYDLGYTSIGCEPCTRGIKPGEDERAGRWWWENPEHKECGLHLG